MRHRPPDSRRLRVAVPRGHLGLEAATGRGRMWREVLSRLARQVELRPAEPAAQRRRWRRPDLWLHDGHDGPLEVTVPEVVQLHEMPWSDPATLATLERRFLEQVVEPSRRAARNAAAIVCPSESARSQIVDDTAVDPAKVFVAHHGVDHSIFSPRASRPDALLARCGADAARPYVLAVASIHPRKNLAVLREAMSRLAARSFPHQLVLVGGPAHGRSDADALERAIRSELPGAPGRLVCIPFGVDDPTLAGLMSHAAAFCLPSLMEGFGLPALEAMACGTPTVVSDRGSLPEIAGDAAMVTEPTVDAVEDALAVLLSDERSARAVGEACHRRAQRFTWDACAYVWFEALRAASDSPAKAAWV